jgi:hypothetical protein
MKVFVLAMAMILPGTALAQWGPQFRFRPIAPAPLVQPIYQAPIIPYPPPIRSYWYFHQSGPGYSFGVGTMPPQPVIVSPQPYIQPFQWGW